MTERPTSLADWPAGDIELAGRCEYCHGFGWYGGERCTHCSVPTRGFGGDVTTNWHCPQCGLVVSSGTTHFCKPEAATPTRSCVYCGESLPPGESYFHNGCDNDAIVAALSEEPAHVADNFRDGYGPNDDDELEY